MTHYSSRSARIINTDNTVIKLNIIGHTVVQWRVLYNIINSWLPYLAQCNFAVIELHLRMKLLEDDDI